MNIANLLFEKWACYDAIRKTGLKIRVYCHHLPLSLGGIANVQLYRKLCICSIAFYVNQ